MLAHRHHPVSIGYPANTMHRGAVVLVLGHRLRRWLSTGAAVVWCIVFVLDGNLVFLLSAGTRQMDRSCFEVEAPTMAGDRPRITIGSESRVRRCVCCSLWLFNHVNVFVSSMYIRHHHHVLYLCHVFVGMLKKNVEKKVAWMKRDLTYDDALYATI